MCEQGGEYLRQLARAVHIGICLLDAIVDGLPRHEDHATIFTYRALYNSVNPRLDHIALLLARRIQDEGISAFPIAASQIINSEKLGVVICHKLAASPAGLGWIGRSCLLITLDYGPRVRFATVLTDARLDAGSPIDERCGDCREIWRGGYADYALTYAHTVDPPSTKSRAFCGSYNSKSVTHCL